MDTSVGRGDGFDLDLIVTVDIIDLVDTVGKIQNIHIRSKRIK